jgi:hypothetical protein
MSGKRAFTFCGWATILRGAKNGHGMKKGGGVFLSIREIRRSAAEIDVSMFWVGCRVLFQRAVAGNRIQVTIWIRVARSDHAVRVK